MILCVYNILFFNKIPFPVHQGKEEEKKKKGTYQVVGYRWKIFFFVIRLNVEQCNLRDFLA